MPRLKPIASLGIGIAALALSISANVAGFKTQAVAGIPPNQPAVVALGKALFYDRSLSSPAGIACVSCHDPATGYTYPASWINNVFGTVPGTIPGRAGNRRPPPVGYAPYLPPGPPHYSKEAQAWVGGLFWDGRVVDAIEQIRAPLVNPNEMNNRVHDIGSSAAVVAKVKAGPSAALFRAAYGSDIFKKPPETLFMLMAKAIVAYEASPEVSPFTSKYDAYLLGKAKLTAQEYMGLRLFTGTIDGRPTGLPFKKSAHCMDCHAASLDWRKSPDIWTNSCYANLGIPRNPLNFYYSTVDGRRNPIGFNRHGPSYVDLGLGGVLYDLLGLPEWQTLDPLGVVGAFKAPSMRNVDARPSPGFVRAYMHNGALKSLKAVVHFYNTRNLTTVEGEVIDFTKPNPYAGLKGTPLWAPPEYLNPNSLINPTGVGAGFGSRNNAQSPIPDPDAMQIGNLRLTDQMEDAIVAFLKTLTDGYFKR